MSTRHQSNTYAQCAFNVCGVLLADEIETNFGSKQSAHAHEDAVGGRWAEKIIFSGAVGERN